MNVREMTFRDESEPKLYACGKCGSVHSPRIYACRDDAAHEAARRAADECCAPRMCDCGTTLDKSWTACFDCRLRDKLRRAKIIPADSYAGPVSASGSGEWGEGYSSSLAALMEHCEGYDEEVPAYCHPCTDLPLHLDVEHILEVALEDMHEDAADQVVDTDALYQFIDDWNARQTAVTYYEDTSRVIVIDQNRFDALVGIRESDHA